jgi:hypothetical protein
MVLDGRRIRLRTRIRKIAKPGSNLYQRNLPRRASRWDPGDSENVDNWSKRVFGIGWFGRVAICLIALAFVAAMHALRHGGAANVIMFAIVFLHLPMQLRYRIRLAEIDLELARAFHAEG